MPTFTALFAGNTVILIPKFDAARDLATRRRHRPTAMVITGDAMGRPLVEALRRSRDDVLQPGGGGLGRRPVLPVGQGRLLRRPPEPADLRLGRIVRNRFRRNRFRHEGVDSVAAQGSPVGPAVVVDDEDAASHPGPGPTGGWPRSATYLSATTRTRRRGRDLPSHRRRTGGRYRDRAKVEVDGSITLLGRGNMVINTGGEKVFAEEVESVVKAHPDVYDAIVIGVPDERWGHRVAAVVRPGTVCHRFRRRGSTPAIVWPATRFRARSGLPTEVERTPSGKPDYRWAKGTPTPRTRSPDLSGTGAQQLCRCGEVTRSFPKVSCGVNSAPRSPRSPERKCQIGGWIAPRRASLQLDE